MIFEGTQQLVAEREKNGSTNFADVDGGNLRPEAEA